MATYRDQAVVLRTHQLGEADRIITFLTRGRGKIRAVAKGIRRTSSKFGGRLEPFQHVDIQFAQGRGALDVVVQAESLHSSRLGGDYTRFTAAEVLVETADRLVVEEGVASVSHYRLLLGALLALEHGGRAPALIVDSYLLRALALAGYAAAIVACAECGREDVHWFSPASGGAVCTTCRPSGASVLDERERDHLDALLRGDWEVAETGEVAVARRADAKVVAFATWHLDRGLRSLPYFER